jgi:hypothetical protein
VQLPVFVTSQDFKTSIPFTMDGDSSNKIFPAAIVSTYHEMWLEREERMWQAQAC